MNFFIYVIIYPPVQVLLNPTCSVQKLLPDIIHQENVTHFKHIVHRRTTTFAVHLHLMDQCQGQEMYRGKTEKTDGFQGIKGVM